jgi:hypothetical protein
LESPELQHLWGCRGTFSVSKHGRKLITVGVWVCVLTYGSHSYNHSDIGVSGCCGKGGSRAISDGMHGGM